MRGALGGVIGEMIDYMLILRANLPTMTELNEELITTHRRWCLLAHSMLWLACNDDLSEARREQIIQVLY